MTNFEKYKEAVSEAMLQRYGISWEHASGEDWLLDVAFKTQLEPDIFVRWFGQHYDLEPIGW